MDIFTKNRLTTWIIALLIVMNCTTLAAIWILGADRLPPHPVSPMGDTKNIEYFLKEELGLTDGQVRQFQEVRLEHFEQSRKMVHEIHECKKAITDELFRPSPDTLKVKRLAEEIGANQARLEQLLFAHFLELKRICQPEQQEKFRLLIHDLIETIRPPTSPPPVERPQLPDGRPPPPVGRRQPPPERRE